LEKETRTKQIQENARKFQKISKQIQENARKLHEKCKRNARKCKEMQ